MSAFLLRRCQKFQLENNLFLVEQRIPLTVGLYGNESFRSFPLQNTNKSFMYMLGVEIVSDLVSILLYFTLS